MLGGRGLLLAGAGVYAVVALTVRRRTREMGLRMALGADGASVVRSVIRRGLPPVLIGAVLGLVASSLVGGRLDEFLFEVSVRDPVSRVDPVEALRAD